MLAPIALHACSVCGCQACAIRLAHTATGVQLLRPHAHKRKVLHVQVEELRARFGANEVTTKQTPEWKKILRRFTDWICILIVRADSLLTLHFPMPEVAAVYLRRWKTSQSATCVCHRRASIACHAHLHTPAATLGLASQ